MTVSFDFNFWTMAIFGLNFTLSIFALISAKNRATSGALESYKENISLVIGRMGERLQAVETQSKNAIDHDDLSSIHKRIDDLHKVMSENGASVSRVEGLLEGILRNHEHRP